VIATCTAAGPALLDDVAAAWCAAIDGMTDYWVGALERRASPPVLAEDARRWLTAAAVRQRPSWALPNEVVMENELARLRDFSAGSRRDVVPTLVLPPQAGHDSCIVDYSPDQSQIATIRAAGLARTFSLDWKGATRSTRDASIEDYLDFIERAVALLGGRVNLVGDCQGGWLATLWAALHPEAVHTLTIAGAPIDFHAGDAAIHHWVQTLTAGGRTEFYRALVAAGGGVVKGEHMLSGFIAMGPQNEIARQLQLLANIRDAEHVARYRELEDWFKHTQDIPARSTCGLSSGSSATMR
jgi:poly(3-hydroxybutyrate) depolymerase